MEDKIFLSSFMKKEEEKEEKKGRANLEKKKRFFSVYIVGTVIMISLKRKFRTAHHEGKEGCPGASLWMGFSSRVQDGFELPRVKWLIPTHLSGARRR